MTSRLFLQSDGSVARYQFEVKAESFDSHNPRLPGRDGKIHFEFLKYTQDVAFQTSC
jgi:hypothetical protein